MSRVLNPEDLDREDIRAGIDCINERLSRDFAIFRLKVDKDSGVVVVVPASNSYLHRSINSIFNLSDEFYDMVVGHFAKLNLSVIFNNTRDRFWFTEK